MRENCKHCGGEGWVSEHHPNVPWREGKGCCGGAGERCVYCNVEGRMPAYFTTLWDAGRGWSQ
jgi:hypothetical protein